MAASRSADGICNRLVAGAAIWGAFFICLLNPMQVLAGRNGNGALIVHTNDAVNYSAGADYCTTFFDNPGSCENAITRTDKDEETPAVIWVLAAFHPDSSPAVTAVQFGLDDNIPQGDGYWANWGKCGPGVLEIADDGWPDTGKNVALAYSEARTDSLFPLYWMAVYGFTYPDTAYLGTRNYTRGDSLAEFADTSDPPVLDAIPRFGMVRWFTSGSNDCPLGGEGNDSSGGSGDEFDNGQWLDGDGQRQWVRDCILVQLRDDLPMPSREPVDSLGSVALDALGRQLGLVSVSRLLRLDDAACFRYPGINRMAILRFRPGTDEMDAARRYAELPVVEAAQPSL
jgi:hypothetical protein